MKPLKPAVLGLCVAMAVVTGPTGTARAASTPNIDTTYGAGGLTTLIGERGEAVMDAGGRMLWIHTDRVTEQATLTRLTVAGVKDQGFGSGGSVDLPFEGRLNANADGTVSVVAVAAAGSGISVHRVSADGSASATDTVLPGVPLEGLRNVSERANGDLLVSAYYQDTLPTREHIVAIDSDGDLNTSWGTGGDLVLLDESVHGVAGDGNAVVVAADANRVRRYTADGDQDLAFGQVNLPSHFQPFTVEVHGGAYYVTGVATDVTMRMAVVKVLPAGYLDATFGTEGMAVGAAHECTPTARRSFVSETGLYLIGHNGDCGASRTYVQRFTTAGFPDVSFGTTGEVAVDQVGTRQSGNSDGGGVQADGRVVVAFGSTDGTVSVTRLVRQRTNPFVALAATKVLSGAKIGARKSAVVRIGGVGGVPATGVAAVALAVTVSATTRAGGVIGYPTGGRIPAVYSNAHNAQQNVIQKLVVPLGTSGRVTLLNNSAGTAALTAVIVGYYRTGAYLPLTQSRLVNSTLAAGKLVTVVIAGRGGVPAGQVAGVTLNLTVRGTAAGTLTVYPSGYAKPPGTVAGHAAGQPGNAGVTVMPGVNGRVTFVNNSAKPATITGDIVGYMPL